jgi:uncharacterized damage-inducible protein DinB
MWANRTWIAFVHREPDVETRPRELLAHVVLGERIWLERIEGEQRTQTFFPVLTEEELLRGLEDNRRRVDDLIPARLAEVVPFRRSSGEAYHARVVDILHHLVTHGYHHRGQLAAHYARRGMAYPNTDHIEYLRAHRL